MTTEPTPTILQAVTAASERFAELCALKAKHDTLGYRTDGFRPTPAQHWLMMFLAAEEWRREHPAETQPLPEPAPDDAGLIRRLDHIRDLERGARALMFQAQGGDPIAVKEDQTLAEVSARLAALVKERDDEVAARVAAQASVAAQIARAEAAEARAELAEGRISRAVGILQSHRTWAAPVPQLDVADAIRRALTGEGAA